MDRRHHPLFPDILNRRALASGALALGLIAGACGGSDGEEEATEPAETTAAAATTNPPPAETSEPAPGDATVFFPDVLDATATQDGDGTWTFSVTLSSPYDTPEQYADAWRVVGPDGTELGFRLLGHDHASEQPFTRSQSGISIPEGITTVTIEGRDQANGWGGDFLEFELPS